MDRVFLDANVLFSASYGEVSRLERLWKIKDIQRVSSAYCVVEAARNLTNSRMAMRLEKLLQETEILPGDLLAPLPGHIRLRSKDRPVLSAAIAGQCSHLLTGDRRDFGPYFGHRIGGVLILLPRDYPSHL